MNVWLLAVVFAVPDVVGCVAGGISWWWRRRRIRQGFSHNKNGPKP